MLKLLKKAIAWLEVRFPEKVVVTVEAYKELYGLMGQYNVALQVLNRKIEALDAKLAKSDMPLTELKADVQKCKDEVSKLHIVLGFNGSSRGLGDTLAR